ncbi:MAG: tetratricopeptide repeat protein [Candidatus Scalindua rubra]|uniref:Kinesin light chain KLC n=1 Tax=Candidatus Scalindua brodae TaxID=237368 RepID=A0A0B0EHJ0_9BACT|nr:MAG: kinesin light chain KLC [Candidatus Scalindua brodae]MBZ0107728.1 tetratricopeptide repeat protein [Candidatus Scalindua rubra]TWU35514.1 photosystem I assembly protein Ycf3 [Candidatus Brocadiaceae bacterium S225]
MKTEFHSIRKNLNRIIFCVLIVSGFFLLNLIFEQKVSAAGKTRESVIVSLKAQGKLKKAMELIDEYINNCSMNVTYSWGYNEKGCIFTLMGEYTKAIYAFQESLRYSDGASDDFITLLNMGSLQHSLGDYADAISYYDEAIIRMDKDDPRRYWLKMHVAWSGFYLSRGDTMALKQVYKEAKPVLYEIERHLNTFNKGKAYALASRIAYQLGKYDKAIKLSKKYAKGKNSDSAMLSLANNLLYLKNEAEANEVFNYVDAKSADKELLALWYWLKGDEQQARINLEGYANDVEREKAWRLIRNDEILPYDMWKEARKQKWFVELIGPLITDHPNASTYRNNLGAAWNGKGNYDKAIEYFEKALQSDLENFGEDHPNVATYRNNLGATWKTKGKYDKAIEYYEMALKSDLNNFGANHPKVATRWNNLGDAWRAKGKYDKAIEYYEKALESDLNNFGEDHPNIAAYRNNLGVAWNAKGEYDKAIEYLEKALMSDIKTFGEKHSNVATYRNNLGAALNAKGEYDKAIEHLEKALSVIQVRLGNDHPDTKTLKTNLRLAKEEKP